MSALRLTRSYHFSAGHRLASPALSDAENARVYGPCYRQHGHNYRIEVTVEGERLNAIGTVQANGQVLVRWLRVRTD